MKVWFQATCDGDTRTNENYVSHVTVKEHNIQGEIFLNWNIELDTIFQ